MWASYADHGLEIRGFGHVPSSDEWIYSLSGLRSPDGAAARGALDTALRAART